MFPLQLLTFSQLITGLILTPVVYEFKFTPAFLTLAANVGLLIGAMVWSIGSDVWGRKCVLSLSLPLHLNEMN